MSARTDRLRAVATELDAVGARLWGYVDAIRRHVEEDLARTEPRRVSLTIEQPCRALIEDSGSIVAGAGFVAAPGLLKDAEYWLEWWTSDPRPGVSRRLAAETDPAALAFRDYTELQWYVGPREHGERHLTGPYVDYLCTDQHTLTATAPVLHGGRFAGVSGIDVLAATIERLLAPWLDAAGPCVVVSLPGRVVASSEPAYVAGDLVRDATLARWRHVRCRELPMMVLAPAPEVVAG